MFPPIRELRSRRLRDGMVFPDLSPLVRLRFINGRANVLHPKRGCDLEPHECLVLELFAHHTSVSTTYSKYVRDRKMERSGTDTLPPGPIDTSGVIDLTIVGPNIYCSHPCVTDFAYRLAKFANRQPRGPHTPSLKTLVKLLNSGPVIDMGQESRKCPIVRRLSYEQDSSRLFPYLSESHYLKCVKKMYDKGYLTIPFGRTDWGNFAKSSPFCPDYGYSRGTPVDRYYLDKFVTSIRNQVFGDTVEIGGSTDNKERYRFYGATSYRALDLNPRDDVSIVADVNDKRALEPTSMDSIVAFNVLEHCSDPWRVVRNILLWLKPGGRAFCAVPNAQRIHRDPKDCWRINPDGFSMLFKDFEIERIITYGNLQTSIASLSGLATEEIDSERLDAVHEEYPVITCIVASKQESIPS